ncbi:MAG: hypothetical protein GXP42_12410 [Chloroflexi bacterium]|nr:hypothetical protein [Chloroflexota bacterium]
MEFESSASKSLAPTLSIGLEGSSTPLPPPSPSPAPESSSISTITATIPTGSTPEPSSLIASSATPAPEPRGLSPEVARDLALDFLRGAYQVKYPANETFEMADLALDVLSFEPVAAYRSGAVQVFIGESRREGARMLTPVLVVHVKNEARWWGEVYDDGLVVTVVTAHMPRPRSKRVNGWVGKVVKLPSSAPYDDYFEGGRGARHGITSNRAEVSALLAGLGDYKGRVKVWGELRYAAQDYNGRQLLVRRIRLLDATPPPIEPPLSATTPAASETTPSPTPYFGPIGAITIPGQGGLLSSPTLVVGRVEGVFENQVLVRIEDEEGRVLGQALARIDASEIGAGGPFQTEVVYEDPKTAQPGRVALYAQSPIDGALTLLAWVNVRLAATPAGKSATILAPAPGARVKKEVKVRGTARGVRHNEVLVRVEGEKGKVWGKARAQVNPSQGDGPGEWEVTISLQSPPSVRPGRIAVYEVDEVAGERTLLASTTIVLVK